jgi:hypothetical protein
MKHFSLVVTFITRQSVFHLGQGKQKKYGKECRAEPNGREPDVPLIYSRLSSSNSDTSKANTDRHLMKSREKTIDTRCAMQSFVCWQKAMEEEEMAW